MWLGHPDPATALLENRSAMIQTATHSEAENLSVHGSFWESLGGFHRVESSNGI
jgi:hypothetical protein